MARKQHVLTATSAAAATSVTSATSETSAASATPRLRLLLVVALILTGLSMRTAVTSVGAVLDDLQRGLHTTSGVAGIVTTLPVICFAVIGAVAPRLSFRFGAHQLLVVALALMTVGLLSRSFVSAAWLFVLLSVLALTGGAISNVLLPSLVKLHFPQQIGRMTAVYTTALAIGTTAAAGLTVPIADAGGGWRVGLGSWALLSGVAVLPWLPTIRHDRPDAGAQRGLSARALLHSRTAWTLAAFFAFQSMQAYIAFGWFAKFLHAHGMSTNSAGWMLALLSAVGIPVSMVVPSIAPARHRLVVVALSAAYAVAYVGLALAPIGGAWLWMVLVGVGSGMFPLALTMIGTRARTSETTAALSAFVQVIGYVVAGTGPLLFGVLYGATNAWAWPLMLLFVGLGVATVAGWMACRARFVDDELAAFAT